MAKAEYRETGAPRHISLDHPLSAADWFVALFISFFKLRWIVDDYIEENDDDDDDDDDDGRAIRIWIICLCL